MRNIIHFLKEIHNVVGKILYLNLTGILLISLFEGIGIFMLIPLINLSGILSVQVEENSPFNAINQTLQGLPENISLSLVLVAYIVLMICQALFQRNQIILNGKIKQTYIQYLRVETYKGLVQANWRFFLRNRKTDIINSMTAELSRVASGTHMFLDFMTSLVFTFVQICLAFWLSPYMTISVILFGLLLILFSRTFIRKSNKIGKQSVNLTKAYLAGITDHFNGIKEIKSNSLEAAHINWIRTFSLEAEKNVLDSVILKTTSKMIYKIVAAFLIAGYAFFSIQFFQAQSAQLLLILVIFARIWPRIIGIQSSLEQFGSLIPSFKALIELKNECLNAQELDDENLKDVKATIIKDELKCNSVYFRYDYKQSNYNLENINLRIPATHMTAIVGPSGAGKSTLIDLLMGLNQPEKGEILIDGVPLAKDNLIALRKTISYVPQDPFLFNATVKENLLMIEPNATEEQIWEALEFSSAAEFVKKLPHGMDTMIGDRGIRLSGGERQRIVLARAILRKPSILVLDEATSALDTENERKIQEAIDQLKGKMTIIVIAHRLSTIRNADQVIVLEQGKVVQKGEFNQLAQEKRGLFRHLLGSQRAVAIKE